MIRKAKGYILGNLRYKLFYSKYFKFLISKKLKLQYEFRLAVMNEECYQAGSCVKCGCTTTALQMASFNCDGDCYPPFMSKKNWRTFINGGEVTLKKVVWRYYSKGYKGMIVHKIFKNRELAHIKRKFTYGK